MPRVLVGGHSSHVAEMNTALGRQADIVRHFTQTQNAGTAIWNTVGTLTAAGYVVVVSTKSSFTFPQVAAGSDDARWTGLANYFATLNQAKIIFAFHHEPENDSALGTAAQYRAAANHVYDLIKSIAPGVRCATILMDYTWYNASGRNPDDWWATSSDLFGLDWYNYRGASDTGSHFVPNPATPDYPNTRLEVSDRPGGVGPLPWAWNNWGVQTVFSEVGCGIENPATSPTAQAKRRAWVQTLAAFKGDPRIYGACWFDLDDLDGKANYRISGGTVPSDPLTVAAFREFGANVVNVTLTPGVDTDQTASLFSQINAVPNGTTLEPTFVHLPSGRYRLNGVIQANNKAHLRIRCPAGDPLVVNLLTGAPRPADNKAFWAYSDMAGRIIGHRYFSLNACTNVVVSNIALDGWWLSRNATGYALTATDPRPQEHAFAISGASTDCGYEDCWSINNGGDGCYVGNPISDQGQAKNNSNNHFTRMSMQYMGRHGLAIVSGDDTTFTDCFADWAGSVGIDTEPNGAYNTTKDIVLTRVSLGGRAAPTAFQSSGMFTHHVPPRYKINNITLTDVRILRTQNGLRAVDIDAGTGEVLIERFISHVGQSYQLSQIAGGGAWSKVSMRDCVLDLKLGGGGTPVPSYGLTTGSAQIVELIGNRFVGDPGKPVQNLAAVGSPTTYTHYGNVWGTAAAPLTDGPAGPAPTEAVISQVLPALEQTGQASPSPASIPAGFGGVLGRFGLGAFQFANPGLSVEALISQTLPALTQSALAESGDDVSGGIVQVLPALQQAATAETDFGAVVSQVLPALEQTMDVSVDVDAEITQTLPALTQLALAESGDDVSAGIVQVLPALEQSAVASVDALATITQVLPALTQAATATSSGSGSGTHGGSTRARVLVGVGSSGAEIPEDD